MHPDLDSLRRSIAAPLPHPSIEHFEADAQRLMAYVSAHQRSLPHQSIGANPTRPQTESSLGDWPPEEGSDFAHVLAEFEERIAPNAFRVNHPRFLAFIPGAPSWYSMLGDMLCDGMNFFGGVWLEGAAPSQIELTVLRWFQNWLGLPVGAGGILTSGGSEANMTALACARESLSFADRQRAVLYVSEQRHGSMDRAAKIIGLRPDQQRTVPADENFRLDCRALVQHIVADVGAARLPWVVTANAGATNTGTVDPLEAVADVCREYRLWLHVDAAYGWPAVLDPNEKDALSGIGRADSITLDPHKWFAQTFESGCLLVREARRLPETFTNQPDYLQDVLPGEEEVNFADHGISLTRRFRALKIWLSVKVLGLDWHRRLIAHSCRLAEYAEALLRDAGCFEVLCPRRLSVVCFRYVPAAPSRTSLELDQINLALVEELRRSGRAFLSSTRLKGTVALRFCFVNWRTTAEDVEEVVTLLKNLARK